MQTHDYSQQIAAAAQYLRQHSSYQPTIGLVLGSGLGALADEIEGAERFPYSDIPHHPVSTVQGHQGQLVLGRLCGQTVIAMQGRLHYYEGYSMKEITFPIRIMQALGIDTMIVTNACGGLTPEYKAGTIMFIRDHINLLPGNPLRGKNDDRLGPRFPDMMHAYDPKLIELGRQIAAEQELETSIGVFTAVTGPCYETLAEVRFLKMIGADAVGMSTIPEVIVARHAGIRVLGLSCITDNLMLESHEPITHEKVVAVADQMRPGFIRLVRTILERLPSA